LDFYRISWSFLAYLAGICGSALPATHQASPLNLYLGKTRVNTGAILKIKEQNNMNTSAKNN
jgi:hypothetical protein